MQLHPYRPPNHDFDGLSLLPDTPRALVLFLHGFGANGADLMGIGQMLAPHLPSVGFIAPNAPGRLPFGDDSRFWFPLNPDLHPEDLDRGVQTARPLIHSYIEAVIEDFQIAPDQLVLVGFSQGCMMALEVAPRLPHPLGYVIGLSGALAGGQRLQTEIKSRPPIYLGHGHEDPVVPFAALDQATKVLRENGLTVKTASYKGIGHSIPTQAIEALIEILAPIGT